MHYSNDMNFTGLKSDDRRITRDLMAMGAFDSSEPDQPSFLAKQLEAIGQTITWMRWKGEVSVYGCRVGVDRATRRLEASTTV